MKIKLVLLMSSVLMTQVAVAQESALESADGNSDGKVTVAEFTEYAGAKLQGFDRLEDFATKVDADGNGEISAEEFEARVTVLRGMASEPQAEKKEDAAAKSNEPHKVGDKASDFELEGLDGKMVKLSDSAGKPRVVVFSRANW